jgi:hypothetical protein
MEDKGYVTLCYVTLCYVTLCYVTLCYVILCYVTLCYVTLCAVFDTKDTDDSDDYDRYTLVVRNFDHHKSLTQNILSRINETRDYADIFLNSDILAIFANIKKQGGRFTTLGSK